MALTQKEYDILEEAEYMIDDVLVTATPIVFANFCDTHSFMSNQYSNDFEGYDVAFNDVCHMFIPRRLFEAISIKSEY